MNSRISERIRYVGVNDLKKSLFEGMWPLPFGVSYNSYLVIDDKVALIDTAEAGYAAEYMENIRRELGERKVDYLVVNHMEPDHSSLMSMIREAYPEARIVGNAKTVPMIKGYYGICENLHIVKEGDSISLGNSTLTFHMTPMVHWPETMMTYFHEEKTLFSGDAFGTFGALADGITDAGARLYGCSDAAADTFEAFQNGTLEDVKGFCAVADLQTIEKQDYILTPGRYVGIEEQEEDSEPFDEKMARLTSELSDMFAKSHELEAEIRKKLGAIGYEI